MLDWWFSRDAANVVFFGVCLALAFFCPSRRFSLLLGTEKLILIHEKKQIHQLDFVKASSQNGMKQRQKATASKQRGGLT
ncbi:hypothetical protein E2562_019192 [Oryza meyeriana var. granulata]|uniref:Uncharacterized protein n=1 Tax=Oryza meyeriana var. granulata TaxID=110450 RepID=A0A6G1FA69_9ORYZ|nr:hypothetical protein E2562_019192 [Oryza meyeriana var. granulata]